MACAIAKRQIEPPQRLKNSIPADTAASASMPPIELGEAFNQPGTPQIPSPLVWNFRLILACFVAVSVSLPMAWISFAKLALFLASLGYLVADGLKVPAKTPANYVSTQEQMPTWAGLWTVKSALAICIAFALSLFWKEVALDEALTIWVKHAKLLEIVLLISLIRTLAEARMVVTLFVAGQAILMLTSWLLVVGVPIPWADRHQGQFVVFSSYLDQSIIFSASATIYWHLRSENMWPQWLGWILALVALANVLLFLEGRTGYIVALSMIGLITFWALPGKWRLGGIVIVPCVLLLGLYAGSSSFQSRVFKLVPEGQAFATQSEKGSSTGWRLNAWHRSLQAIGQRPWIGHGVGGWTGAVKKLEGEAATKTFGTGNASNPHQEFLLWAVELGIAGGLLLLAFMICIWRDALGFPTQVKRSILSVLAALAIACLFNSALYDGLIGDYFVVTLGLLFSLGVRSGKSIKGTPRSTSTVEAVA